MKEISERKIKAKWIHASIADWEKEFCKWNVSLHSVYWIVYQSEKNLTVNCAILDTECKQTLL